MESDIDKNWPKTDQNLRHKSYLLRKCQMTLGLEMARTTPYAKVSDKNLLTIVPTRFILEIFDQIL